MLSTYLIVNILTIILTFSASFEKRLAFFRYWLFLFPSILISGIFLIIWDAWFTYLGIWGFNPEHLIGIYLFGLPLEEILFFITVPYSCMFLYEVGKLIRVKPNALVYRNLTGFLSLGLFIAAVFSIGKAYTFSAFLLASLLLAFHYLQNTPWLKDFYVMYILSTPFFLAVNGILTYLPVVWYDNSENLAIRLVSIPVEDFIYSLFMLLSTVSIYEALKTAKANQSEKKLRAEAKKA
jgi:lycopene cyclase domain-containing protein